MHSVIETPIFTKRADALLTVEERADLIRTLSENPRSGTIIPGMGGARKMRFGGGGRGKQGGFRVVWYVAGDDTPILALLLYGKGDQVDLTPDQKRAFVSIIKGGT